MVTVVRETFRGIGKRRPELVDWQCTKFDWLSKSLFRHFWRSSGVMVCCFWLVFLCQWVLGWWLKDSMVCLDLPRTIFTTSATLFNRGVGVWSPWINNPHGRLGDNVLSNLSLHRAANQIYYIYSSCWNNVFFEAILENRQTSFFQYKMCNCIAKIIWENYRENVIKIYQSKNAIHTNIFTLVIVCFVFFITLLWNTRLSFSYSHWSKSWHQTHSAQVCSNQSQLVMDTERPVTEL